MKYRLPIAFMFAFLLCPVVALACDADNDGICDDRDNCVLVANVDQRDTDGDGFGNVCDADLNNDCIVNFADLHLIRSLFFTRDPNCDLNGDGWVNFPDLHLIRSMVFAEPGPSGVPNVCS